MLAVILIVFHLLQSFESPVSSINFDDAQPNTFRYCRRVELMIVTHIGNKICSLVTSPFSDSSYMTDTHNSLAEEWLLVSVIGNKARYGIKDVNNIWGYHHASVVFLSNEQERCDSPVAFDYKKSFGFMFIWDYNNSLYLQKPVRYDGIAQGSQIFSPQTTSRRILNPINVKSIFRVSGEAFLFS